MAKDIKQTIKLDGERQYTDALKKSYNELKRLRSELKAETAELGKNATQQDKDATKANNLKKQLVEQEKVVNTLRKALADAKTKYGENSDEVGKWEIKLNQARTTLANMKSSLEDVSDGLDKVKRNSNESTVAAKSFADSIQSIGTKAGGLSDAIGSVFSSVVDTIKSAITEVWQLIDDTADKANNWTDQAHFYGTNTAEVEKWTYAVAASGNATENFFEYMKKLAYGGLSDKITETFGVSDVNYTNRFDYALAVMDAMYKKRDEMIASGSWYSSMAEIFGDDGSQKFEDLLTDWETIQGLTGTFDANNGGFGLTDEQIAAFAQIATDSATVAQEWEAIKTTIASIFGDTAHTLLIDVQGGLEGLNAFLKAETPAERETALAEMKESIEKFFRDLADAIRAGLKILSEVGEELSASEDSTTAMIGKLLTGITDAFQYFVDHQDAVITAIEAIFGVFLTGKVAQAIASVASFVANLNVIKGFGGFSAAAGAAGAAGAGAGGTAALGGMGAVSTISSSIAVPAAALTAGLYGLSQVGYALEEATGNTKGMASMHRLFDGDQYQGDGQGYNRIGDTDFYYNDQQLASLMDVMNGSTRENTTTNLSLRDIANTLPERVSNAVVSGLSMVKLVVDINQVTKRVGGGLGAEVVALLN